jgi:hypothetical protein
MIRDVAEFRRTGVASRRTDELNMPVEVWRAAMCRVARRDGARVRTFVVPSAGTGPDERFDGRMVFAVRVDPPLDREEDRGAQVRCRRVDELGMPFPRWRATLHRAARRERTRVRTFLVPGRRAGREAPDQLVYLVWADAGPVEPVPATPRPSVGAPRPVTDLARYAAARNRSTTTRHDVDGTEC